MNFADTIARSTGIDKAIAYSSGARIVQSICGLCIIFFISKFLSGVEQGFYFTFGSIAALQVFFELGLTSIITQFVAHEAAHLTQRGDIYVGEDTYKSRLASLLRFCCKWYAVISLMAFTFLLIVGFIFFGTFYDNQNTLVDWKGPWILLSFATALQLFQSPFNSILMGLGKVKKMNKILFYQQSLILFTTCIGFLSGLKLYTIGLGIVCSVVLWFVYIIYSGLFSLLRRINKTKITESVSYIKEIFPFQWRIALSWLSGYFIFQLFNPVLFAVEGAVVAGQMGMTLQALNVIQVIAMSWQNTKVPLYSSLISLKDYKKLDTVFTRTLYQMIPICLLLTSLLFIFIALLKHFGFELNNELICSRFLDLEPMLFLATAFFANIFVFSWATYLRCHKKEPFLVQSVVMGILCSCSTILLGKTYGVYGITLGYMILIVGLSIPWSVYIFKSKKRAWHGN